MLSRDCTSINSTSCQLQLINLPPHFEFVQLTANNTITETQYLVQHQKNLPNQKNDSHPILADYDPLLNETDLDSDDDPISKLFPNTPKSQSSEFNKPTVSNPLDPHLQQELLYNISVVKSHSLAIIPIPIKPNSANNIISYLNASLFKHAQEFINFFLPPNTPLTLQVIKEQQKLDPVLSIVYEWIKNKTKAETLNPSIKCYSFLHTYYKQFSHLFIDPTSNPFQYFLDNHRSFEELNSPRSQPIINKTRICLPFELFHVAFTKTNSHRHCCEKLSKTTFNHF